MSASVKNVYQFRTTTKITQGQWATSTFDIWNDIFTNSSVTITGGSVKLENRTGSQVELMTITATGWTATIAARGILPDGTTNTDYQYERPRNTLCTVTILESQLANKTDTNTFTATNTFTDIDFTGTTTGGLKVKSLTTVQRNAVAAPANGMIIYNSTTSELNQYIWGAWSAISAWSTQPNASTTVAGKVELATEAEGIAGTSTGGTGAALDLTPDLIAKITQSGSWVYCVSTTGSDTYTASLTPALTAYTTGMLLPCKFTTTNTGACSININSLWAKSIKTLDWNDPQTGVIRANGVALLQYDWTNFVIHASDFATTSNVGVIEIATDAEVATGTDTTRSTTPAQLRANSRTVSWTTTRLTSNSTGSQTIAHWLGIAPRMVQFQYVQLVAIWAWNGVWLWSYDWTTNRSIGIYDAWATTEYRVWSTFCIERTNSSWVGRTASAAVDATNITLSWTKWGAGLDIWVLWTAHA